jgi:hypothetical protein
MAVTSISVSKQALGVHHVNPICKTSGVSHVSQGIHIHFMPGQRCTIRTTGLENEGNLCVE